MAKQINEATRVQAVRAAFRQRLLPRLEQDTLAHRETGRVFYRGRWMEQKEAMRIHYMLKRDSERSMLDLVLVNILVYLLFGFILWRGPALMMQLF
jgi:hypothetical protein